MLGEVQRLVGLVGEERITADIAAQRGAANQIGMEDQRPPLGLELLAVVLDARDLPGSDGHDGPLLIIVVLTAVDQIAAPDLLEKKGVEAESMAHVTNPARLGEVDDRHQRVEGLDAQQVVVLENMLEMLDFIHGCAACSLQM